MPLLYKRKKVVGTLVPVSALNSEKQNPNDFGTFETGLYFLDWLKKTGQNGWVLLPLNQTQLEKGSATKHVPSPYKGYGIGLDPRYLSRVSKVSGVSRVSRGLERFVRDNKNWITDYALFCALRDYFGTDDWRKWEDGLRKREKKVLDLYNKKLEKEVNNHIFIQYKLHKEYGELKHKAEKLNIKLIGDLPFYVSVQSPLVWAHQGAFQIGKNGDMQFVSGTPNSPVALFGRQIWGHPLYKWGKENQQKDIKLWEMRLRYCAELFDCVRLDYAKGLFVYGAINLKNEKEDTFREGPGGEIFKEILKFGRKNGLEIFAEDLGDKVNTLRESLETLDIAGIRVLRFAFDEKRKKIVERYADISSYPINTIAYTTTHDTETLLGYLQKLSIEQKKQLSAATHVKYELFDKKFAKKLREAVIFSPAQVVIIPIQDWLLTTDRINIPGTEKEFNDPNWRYRLKIPVEKLPTVFK